VNPLVASFADDTLAYLRRLDSNGYPRVEAAVMEFIEETMAKSKRPPVHGTIKSAKGMRLRIFLNQKEVFEVLEYNTETGYILKNKLNEKGLPVISNGSIATEELHGSVLVTRIS